MNEKEENLVSDFKDKYEKPPFSLKSAPPGMAKIKISTSNILTVFN